MGGWPEQFFSMTPRLYAVVAEGRANAEGRRFRLTAWHAHTVASLDRARRIPLLSKLIGGQDVIRRSTVKQSTEELMSIARRWTAALVKPRRPDAHEG